MEQNATMNLSNLAERLLQGFATLPQPLHALQGAGALVRSVYACACKSLLQSTSDHCCRVALLDRACA